MLLGPNVFFYLKLVKLLETAEKRESKGFAKITNSFHQKLSKTKYKLLMGLICRWALFCKSIFDGDLFERGPVQSWGLIQGHTVLTT